MDSKIIGSFSYTSFVDLYDSHLCSWYDTCELYEILADEDGKNTKIVSYSQDINNFNRVSHESYLLGILYDSKNPNIEIQKTDTLVFFQESYKERKKINYMSLEVRDSFMALETHQKNHLFVDEYFSLSSMPLNNFDPLLPKIHYSLDIHEVSWASFGYLEGYGSRNRLKKDAFPQYDKSS